MQKFNNRNPLQKSAASIRNRHIFVRTLPFSRGATRLLNVSLRMQIFYDWSIESTTENLIFYALMKQDCL